MNSKNNHFLLIIGLGTFLTLLSIRPIILAEPQTENNVQEALLKGSPKVKGHYLYFEGEGKADQNLQNQTQKRSLSKEAALLEAKTKIAYYIDQLKTKKGKLIKEERTKNKKMEFKVSIFIKGIQPQETQWDEYDNCKATVRIHKKRLLNSLKAKEP